MAGGHYIFSIYKTSGSLSQYFILRTVLPDYRNWSQTEEEKSRKAESVERLRFLEFVKKQTGTDELEIVGEFHGLPDGEVFYQDHGHPKIPVYYMQTDFGKPWIIFGKAGSEEEFLEAIANDEDLQILNPVRTPVRVEAWFLTTNELNFN